MLGSHHPLHLVPQTLPIPADTLQEPLQRSRRSSRIERHPLHGLALKTGDLSVDVGCKMLAWFATIEAVAEPDQNSLQPLDHRGNGLDIHVSSPSSSGP